MKRYFLLFLLLPVFTAGQAQTAEDSVKATVRGLFDAMKQSDSAMLVSVFADSAILQSVTEGKDGKTRILSEAVKEFAGMMRTIAKGAADERIQFETVRVDGALAIVWAPYQFYYNGRLHHCGADSFQLVRLNGVWKIQYLIDTRRKNCP